MYAIWALPKNNDFKYLKEIVNDLSKKYDFPNFTPHITLYGLVDTDLANLKYIIKNCIYDIPSFKVTQTEIAFSNDFWKSIFIVIEPEKNLRIIQLKLKKSLKKFSDYDFNPHISLIYKKLSKAKKIQIINNLTIREEITIDKICILKYSENISDWKIIKKFYLR